jgi:hypothetical protein
VAEKDLSQMSFDERMALYKKKYDTAAPGSEQKKPAKRGSRKPVHSKEAPSPQKQPEQAAPPKKGFLSRLLGKFRRK